MLSCCIVGAPRWSIVDAQLLHRRCTAVEHRRCSAVASSVHHRGASSMLSCCIVGAQRWSIVDARLCIDDISASPFGVYFIYLVKQKRTAFDIWTVYVTQVT